MDFDFITGVANQGIKVALLVSAPMLLGSLFMGILISIFQAVTQINEQTQLALILMESRIFFDNLYSDNEFIASFDAKTVPPVATKDL